MAVKKSRCLNFILIVTLSLLFFILSGCSLKKDKEEVPELIKPVATNASYRPVGRKVTGLTRMLGATVVPTEYACFSYESVVLSEINVGVGDEVKEGDVIAKESDIALENEIRSLKDTIASLKRDREKAEQIYNLQLAKLWYTVSGNEGDREYLMTHEDHRYEIAVIDERLKECRTKLQEKENKRSKNVFTAPHSGTVVFVKDLSAGNRVDPYENIVVIADLNDLYLECKDLTIKEYKFTDYKEKWIMLNGQKTEITEYPYTNAETAYAAAAMKNPPMRFVVPGHELKMGDDAMLFFMKDEAVERLYVGNDSIYSENGESYVYIKAGDDVNVKRVIVTGDTDGDYTEVLSGLSDNDIVFYKNSKMPPSKYETISISINDYKEENTIKSVDIANPYYDLYLSPHNGSFKRIKEPGKVQKDAELYALTYISGRADTEAGRISIEDLDLNRAAALKTYKEARKSIIDAAGEVSETISDNDALMAAFKVDLAILDLENDYDNLEYEAQKVIRNRDYSDLKKINGANGSSVKAKTDGTVEYVKIRDGQPVSMGDFILALSKRADDAHTRLTAVIPGGHDDFQAIGAAKIGQEIRVVKDDKTIATGNVIGINGSLDRFILFTKDEKQYATYSKPFEKGGKLRFYARTNETLSDNDVKGAQLIYDGFGISNVVTVPVKSVHTEKNQLDGTQKRYVWKIENGEVVKEYIQIYETDAPVTQYYVISGLEEKDIIVR